jgi:hypothetical protein
VAQYEVDFPAYDALYEYANVTDEGTKIALISWFLTRTKGGSSDASMDAKGNADPIYG